MVQQNITIQIRTKNFRPKFMSGPLNWCHFINIKLTWHNMRGEVYYGLQKYVCRANKPHFT